MKIAFLTDVYKPVMNGVVISITSFAEQLRRFGNAVYIFAPRYPGYRDREGHVKRFRIVQKLPANYYLQIPVSVGIGNLIKECDIIHVHHPFVSGLVGLYRSKLHRIPLVFTHHTVYEEYSHYMPFIGKTEEFKKGLNEYVAFFCNNCDCVIAPTESIRELLKARGVKTRIEVIPTGFNMQRFQKADGSRIRKKYGGGILVLYLGRMAKEKNIELLIDVFKDLTKKNKSVKFIFVGEGPLREELEKKTEEFKNIIFTGRVREVEPYYKAADIFVSASKTETQGIVFAEAKAAGLPVVALDAMGARDMVKDNDDGFLADTKEDFKAKLLELIENEKLRKKMSKNALKNSKNYSMAVTTRRLLRIYKSLMIKKQ